MAWTLLERELSRNPWTQLFDTFRTAGESVLGAAVLPAAAPLNVSVGERDVVVRLELPGIDPKDVQVAIEGEHLKIAGERKTHELADGERFHRRERAAGHFERYVQLPYRVDAGKVEAIYELGILEVRMPRAEADLPRRIEVRTARPAIEASEKGA
jgi:HSP20 family protein